MESKEIVVLKNGKPFLKNMAKIAEIIAKEKNDLLFILPEFLKMFEHAKITDTNVSYFTFDIFEHMPMETLLVAELKITVSGYDVLLTEEEGGGFSVRVPSLPGCISQGETEKEAIENIVEAIEGYLQCVEKYGVKVRP